MLRDPKLGVLPKSLFLQFDEWADLVDITINNSIPVSYTSIITKHEVSANRPIYAVALLHYLVSAYVFDSLEGTSSVKGTTLN